MSRLIIERQSLTLPLVNGVRLAVVVAQYRRFTLFHNQNGSTGTWQVEASADGTNWIFTGMTTLAVSDNVVNVGEPVFDTSIHIRACGSRPYILGIRATSNGVGLPICTLIGEREISE